MTTSPASRTPPGAAAPAAPGRLARRLGLGDAVVIGLGAMIGAGVFGTFGLAAATAGPGLLIGLGVAAIVAYCNATSSARLAARYPESGGTYVYGRERLGAFWGYLAGWAFVVGKTASCAAMALTLVVIACLAGGTADLARLRPFPGASAGGILQAAGLLFFAFAGYARIATLGEEVREPARTIPRAIAIALGLTLVVYAAVAFAALLAIGADGLAGAAAPLGAATRAGSLHALTPAVRVGGAVASLGALLALMLGVSRTTLAMARDRRLPGPLDAVHPRHQVPHRAGLAVGLVVAALAASVDLRGAIGFSSFGVLVYYAIANASAFTLRREEHRPPRWLPLLGLTGCMVLAFSLPATSMVAGLVVLATGALLWGLLAPRCAGGSLATPTTQHPIEEVQHVATIRYIVDDVDAAISFYTERLGFGVVMHPAPVFAILSREDLRLLLSAPVGTGGGAQAMPDGRRPEPGGWNRFQIEVDDLDATVADLREAGLHFRNEIVTGVGGRQILLDDPSGNAVELFESARS